MSSRSTGTAGLSTADVESIRGTLAAGRKPKVVFTDQAGQIAGQVGQVVQLADPAQSDEWLVVRFGKDELPFSPADLSLPARGRGRNAAGDRGASPETGASPKTGGTATTGRSGASAAAAPDEPAPGGTRRGSTRTGGAADGAEPAGAGSATSSTGGDTGGGEPARSGGQAGARPAKRTTKPARAARPKPPAAMTVTLAYDSGEWTVAAHQGSKTLAKPYVVRAAEALKMVSMLDVPGVQEAVSQIVNAELAEAQRRAETLRSELAEVEARVADLRDTG